jgi:hypothetical protein
MREVVATPFSVAGPVSIAGPVSGAGLLSFSVMIWSSGDGVATPLLIVVDRN